VTLRQRAGAGLLALVVAAPPIAAAAEHEIDHHGATASADLERLDPQTREVARRLWGDLVCLCGRCERQTLSTCHCPDAARERKQILDSLRGHDLSSRAGGEAAYQAVLSDFVRQKGRGVLASNRSNSLASDWLILLISGAILALACFVVGIIQSRRKKVGRSKRLWRH
jgi:hypothetical protein